MATIGDAPPMIQLTPATLITTDCNQNSTAGNVTPVSEPTPDGAPNVPTSELVLVALPEPFRKEARSLYATLLLDQSAVSICAEVFCVIAMQCPRYSGIISAFISWFLEHHEYPITISSLPLSQSRYPEEDEAIKLDLVRYLIEFISVVFRKRRKDDGTGCAIFLSRLLAKGIINQEQDTEILEKVDTEWLKSYLNKLEDKTKEQPTYVFTTAAHHPQNDEPVAFLQNLIRSLKSASAKHKALHAFAGPEAELETCC
ncbi:hypothetical protein DFP72DRAFT_1076403 [Ephemerocybe angulata]|uniref:Uncharacterized protein n=1 Tax=Ephemerocybe angulata TaxID=980116 RepID=A0A8H6LY62_9AGAR|nr:hypothetical protein DFP72DRAFT_1076403 [Tulosesus angulatus]